MKTKVVYWVIWFPAFARRTKFEVLNNPIQETIGDEVVNENVKEKSDLIKLYYKLRKKHDVKKEMPIYIKFVDKDNKVVEKGTDIVCCNVEIKYSTDQEEKTISLQYLNHSSDGLFLYKCSADSHQTVEDIEKHATAYHFKKVCHSHLFHSVGDRSKKNDYRDYFFKIYSKKTKPKIDGINNDVIKDYLKAFQDRYELIVKNFEDLKCPTKDTEQNDDLSVHIKKTQDEIHVALGLKLIEENGSMEDKRHAYNLLTDNKKKKVEKAIDTLNKKIYAPTKDEENTKPGKKFSNRELYEKSISAVGETLYINTLLSSKYLDPNKDVDVCRYLSNLNNLTTTLYYIRDYYRYQHEEKEGQKSLKWTIRGIWIGIIVSVILNIISFCYTLYETKSKNNTQTEIKLTSGSE